MQQSPVPLVVAPSSVAETISLLGDTLYTLPLDPAGGPARVQRLTEARETLAKDSSELRAWLQLGARTTEMGRLREAVSLYTRMAEVFFFDPRVWRARGEVLLRLRYLDRAIADLQKAGVLALNGSKLFLETLPNPDSTRGSAWANLTTLQYQVRFLLGVAFYCKGDYSAAANVLAEAVKSALTTDEISQALLWLFFAVRRVGDGSGANQILSLTRPEWAQGAHLSAITLLLGFQGRIPSDSIRKRALSSSGADRALFSYGIAFYLQLKPEQTEDAELWLEQTRTGDWSALAYLAAEADLARRRGAKIIIR